MWIFNNLPTGINKRNKTKVQNQILRLFESINSGFLLGKIQQIKITIALRNVKIFRKFDF
jgi:hypothetical protein